MKKYFVIKNLLICNNFLTNIFNSIESNRMKLAGHVARMKEMWGGRVVLSSDFLQVRDTFVKE